MAHYLAIDIGASSGRHIVGWLDGGEIVTDEVYRFANGADNLDGSLVWDVERIFAEVKAGIAAALKKYPDIVSVSIDTWAAQNAATQGFIIAAQITVPIVAFLLIAALSWYTNIDKKMPKIKAELAARYKAEAEARGEVYVSPEEKEKIEQEELDRVAEEKRVEELRDRCAKKGLDFQAEEAKYQWKLLAKAPKANKNKK